MFDGKGMKKYRLDLDFMKLRVKRAKKREEKRRAKAERNRIKYDAILRNYKNIERDSARKEHDAFVSTAYVGSDVSKQVPQYGPGSAPGSWAFMATKRKERNKEFWDNVEVSFSHTNPNSGNSNEKNSKGDPTHCDRRNQSNVSLQRQNQEELSNDITGCQNASNLQKQKFSAPHNGHQQFHEREMTRLKKFIPNMDAKEFVPNMGTQKFVPNKGAKEFVPSIQAPVFVPNSQAQEFVPNYNEFPEMASFQTTFPQNHQSWQQQKKPQNWKQQQNLQNWQQQHVHNWYQQQNPQNWQRQEHVHNYQRHTQQMWQQSPHQTNHVQLNIQRKMRRNFSDSVTDRKRGALSRNNRDAAHQYSSANGGSRKFGAYNAPTRNSQLDGFIECTFPKDSYANREEPDPNYCAYFDSDDDLQEELG